MTRIALISCAALVAAACGQPAAEVAAEDAAPEAEIAWTQDYESCGFELQSRTVWGAGVTSSGLEMQQVTAEPGMVLRVWSETDAGLQADGGLLTGRATAPAWIAADVRPDAYLIRLGEGAADLRVNTDGFFCAAAGAAAHPEQ